MNAKCRTGRQRRSPIIQGGLKIPCYVTLHGKKKLVVRAKDIRVDAGIMRQHQLWVNDFIRIDRC